MKILKKKEDNWRNVDVSVIFLMQSGATYFNVPYKLQFLLK